MGRTLLSDAFAVEVDFDFQAPDGVTDSLTWFKTNIKFEIKFNTKVKTKFKGDGQECPSRTRNRMV